MKYAIFTACLDDENKIVPHTFVKWFEYSGSGLFSHAAGLVDGDENRYIVIPADEAQIIQQV